MSFDNPFNKFLGVTDYNATHSSVFRSPQGQTLGYTHEFGGTTYINDELGRNMYSIQHLTNGTDLIHNNVGQLLGSAHHVGDNKIYSDSLGNEVFHTQDFGNHQSIHDQAGHLIGNINHFGDTTSVTDALGTVEFHDASLF